MFVCVPAYMHVHRVCGACGGRQGIESPAAGVTDGSEPPDAVAGHQRWQERQVLLPRSQCCALQVQGFVLFLRLNIASLCECVLTHMICSLSIYQLRDIKGVPSWCGREGAR